MKSSQKVRTFSRGIWLLAIFSTVAFAGEDNSLSATELIEKATLQEHVLIGNVAAPDDPGAPAERRFLNYLSAGSEIGRINFGADLTTMMTEFQNTGVDRLVSLEKKHVSYVGDDLRADLGDSTQLLGRGIALDLYRDDVFGIYNTLEGLSARYDASFAKISGFAGRVNALVAPVALNPIEYPLTDRQMMLAGGVAELNAFEGSRLGLHAFTAQQMTTDNTESWAWNTVGAVVAQDNVLEGIDVYLEPNIVLRDHSLFGKNSALSPSFGTFVSIAMSPDQWKIKLEAKDYRNYDFGFRRPPTLEDELIASLNNEDVSLARFQAERRVGPLALTASVAAGYDRVIRTQIYHGIIGSRFHWGRDELELKAGYRLMPGDNDITHAAVKFKVGTFAGQSLEMNLRRQLEAHRISTTPFNNDRNLVEATYNFSERWSLGLGFENVPTNPASLGADFFNANIAYKAGAKSARAFLGSTSGGARCSGGVCRVVPPFSGALLEGYYSF
ncbi:MAG: hypothetical protein HYZ71_17375 [Deltaproteobacteria bacterium]|nr:hypothetical protein [Deltaproteobacteria bacterium]